MYVKILRYRVLPEQLQAFLEIQRRAAEIYRMHLPAETRYFQSSDDPAVWIEVHRYGDREAFLAVSQRLQHDPVVRRLWQEFQATLDPQYPGSIEQYEERPLGPSDGRGESFG